MPFVEIDFSSNYEKRLRKVYFQVIILQSILSVVAFSAGLKNILVLLK